MFARKFACGCAIAALAIIVASPGEAAGQQSPPLIHRFETPGNLQSNYKLDCIPASAAKNVYTPADLYKAVRKCVDAEKYADGVFLYALAGVYGRFDALRVVDKTAHQAILALQMRELWDTPEPNKDRMQEKWLNAVTDKKQHDELCSKISLIGPPNYRPDYMIQHGMDAFNGIQGDGLVGNFDDKAGWGKALDTYLHCPALPIIK